MLVNALDKMKMFLNAKESMAASDWKLFSEIWDLQEFKRKEIITRSGEIEDELYFIVDGIQRIYYITESGNEATLILTYPHSFGGVIDSFLLESPSKYTYEALSQSILLKTTRTKFNEVTSKSRTLDELFKQLTYAAMSGLLERMVELQCYSAEEKFRTLLKRSPHILQLIPHKYLANYLGIDPSNFSKFLNTVKI